MKKLNKNQLFTYLAVALLTIGLNGGLWAQQSTTIPVDDSSNPPRISGTYSDFNATRGSTADIVDIAVRSGSFKILVAALTAADLVDDLKGPGPFTVFAPTDDAFAKLPPETLRALLDPSNKDLLISILTFHVSPGTLPAASIVKLDQVRTLNGQPLSIATRDRIIKVENAKVVLNDIFASNGVIQVIDTVMIPDPAASNAKDMAEYLRSREDFSTLLTALRAGGLLDALKGDTKLTLFAPTNDAFDMIPPRVLNNLLDPKNKSDLVSILTYHVVPGEYFAADLVVPGYLPTLNGERLFLDYVGRSVFVENSKVTAVDVVTSNGVIHVIDAVLIP